MVRQWAGRPARFFERGAKGEWDREGGCGVGDFFGPAEAGRGDFGPGAISRIADERLEEILINAVLVARALPQLEHQFGFGEGDLRVETDRRCPDAGRAESGGERGLGLDQLLVLLFQLEVLDLAFRAPPPPVGGGGQRARGGPVGQPGFGGAAQFGGSGGSRRGRGIGLQGAGAGGASCARSRVSRRLTAVTSVKVITTPSIRSSTVR